MNLFLSLGTFALLAATPSTNLPSPAADVIRPGAVWLDDRGQQINAHGGGVTKLGDTYYWFGE
jgi:hypothetical protein